MSRRNESTRKASELLVKESLGVSWCCERHCRVAIMVWSGYCFLSFVSFVLNHLMIATPRNCRKFH